MKVLKWLDNNFELLIMGISLATITLVVFADICGRTIFGVGLVWAQELSRTCEIIIAAMGISYAVKANKHIKVDLIQTFFPKTRVPLDIFGDIVVVAWAAFMSYYGVFKLQATLASKATTAVLEIPMFCIYLAMEIGLVLAVVRTIEKYIKRACTKNNHSGGAVA